MSDDNGKTLQIFKKKEEFNASIKMRCPFIAFS